MKRDEVKIRTIDLTKIYKTEGGKEVSGVIDLTLDINSGELLCVIGPSGCGKTTFLNLLAGLIEPSSGKILIEGAEVKGPGKERGMIFQEDAILLWRTVMENAAYGLELAGMPKKKRHQIAMEYLQLVGLEDYADLFPKELSGGMKKRVQIATVFANNPEVLLMDEPFGSLDYPSKIELQEELLRIWSQFEKTTVFVTHDVEEALFLADRILVLLDGKFQTMFEVPFVRPRSQEIRISKEFSDVKGDILRIIQEEELRKIQT